MWQNSDINIEAIENSFISISESMDQFCQDLYLKLFEENEDLKHIFESIDTDYQTETVRLIDYFINNIRDDQSFNDKVKSLGDIYSDADYLNIDLITIKQFLLLNLKNYLSDTWDSETEESWNRVCDYIIEHLESHIDKNSENQESADLEDSNVSEGINDMSDTDNNTEQAAEDDVELLESSFALLSDQAEALVERFYERLFEQYPQVSPLFQQVEMSEQKKKLLSALKLVIENLRKPETLKNALHGLGQRHQEYGVLEEHYPAVQENLLSVMQEFAGDAWTDEIHNAWSQALVQIIEIMLEAYDQSEVTMSNTANENDVEALTQELEELKKQNHEMNAKFVAIDQVRAIVEYDMNGVIIFVNKNFVDLIGYPEDEIVGKQHKLFLPSTSDAVTFDKNLWEKLNRCEFDSGQYVFKNKNDELIWVQAYYAPIQDMDGKPMKVVQYATDVTTQKYEYADFNGKLEAISRTQAVIEFNLDGTIITANDNFLNTVGYSLEEIQGKHHRMFVESEYANSVEYKQFWQKLNSGEFESGQFKRIHKDGSEIWINASYNPVFDQNGLPFKIVKYATDGTELRQKQISSARLQSAMDGAQANFMLCDNDLNIVYANPAVVEMLRKRQNELRAIWPSLDVDNLIGQNIDQFHKNPAHQRALLSDPNRLPAKAEIKVGDLEFSVNATMIKDYKGDYMGNMVEWQDITEQKKAERQIEGLIVGASNGELDTRMQDLEQFEGFIRALGEGINSMLDSFVTPIKESMRVVQAMADGDLTQTMDGEYKGQFADLRDSVNACTSNLLNMVNEIRSSSGSISTSSNEIVQGNTDLSSRTEQQASALEETASTIEEMTGTVKQNADNAKQANQLASSARDTAEKGGSVVNNAVNAMSEINSSSKKIADIIGVIDEIAFQTNLLALNAAVEAARAGDQGRGFAVVASEVRNLAQRSAAAAKEIKSLINDSVDKVEEGSRLVDESGQTLEDIVMSVKKVSDIIAEIAAAGEEQYLGIEQINKAVSEMDQMTQQNAALVEEAAAASQAMNQQSHSLGQLVTRFDVGDAASQVVVDALPATDERRSDSRPWASNQPMSKDNTPSLTPHVPAASAAAGGGGDDEWEEF